VRSRTRTPLVVALAAVVVLAAACGAGAPTDAAPSSTTPGSSSPDAPGGSNPGTAPAPHEEGASDGPAAWTAYDAVDPVGETIDGSTVTPDGRTRTWHLYVPTSLPSDRPVPLLVGLHGGTGWGEQFQRSSGFDAIAEANGFLVVFPDGVGVGPTETLRTWNGGVCCGPASRDAVDDVGFLVGLVGELSATYDIDPDRVYAAGHSNGSVMSIRLACEAAGTFVAVGSQAGSMTIDECDPAEPVSMLHLHGEADENVPPQGGKGTKGISGVTWPPVLDGLEALAAAEDCPEPVPVDDPDDPELIVQRWSPCADGTEIEYVLVPGADHAWMGGRLQRQADPTGPSFAGFESSVAIWAFLASHPRR
jgi:polyhydroxybutyrate depolymerase